MVALLPLKANSERVSGKNFREFHGKPLFRWTLDALLSLEKVEQVIINTDARDLLENIGLPDSDKILIRDRKTEICGDLVSMNKVIADDLNAVEASAYLMTHTTNPLISPTTFSDAIDSYFKSTQEGFDSVFSVNKYQSRFFSDQLNPINHDPDNLIRTQDLQPMYEENSCLYLFSRESFIKKQSRIGLNPGVFVTPFSESVDIDDHDTWKLAEAYYTLFN